MRTDLPITRCSRSSGRSSATCIPESKPRRATICSVRLSWLPGVLGSAGLDVYVLPGAATRGGELTRVDALIGHDTVAGHDVENNRRLLRDGRPGLAGPLSQIGGRPDGGVDVIATGRANHNGYGRYGNQTIGWEVYCYGGLSGKEQPWNEAQREAFVKGASAIRRHLGQRLPVLGHKESDPSRKIDPYGVDMEDVRRRIAAEPSAGDAYPVDNHQEDDEMFFYKVSDGGGVHIRQAGIVTWVPTGADYNALVLKFGQPVPVTKQMHDDMQRQSLRIQGLPTP